MSVLLETSLGDIVIDLDTAACPVSSTNFLKLCAKHYYKFNAFFTVTKDFLAQTGDPTDTGKGGASIWSQLPSGSRDRTEQSYFKPEVSGKHIQKGTVSFACSSGKDASLIAASQFFITLTDKIDYLDGKHAPFGSVVEGHEPGGTLDKMNAVFVDAQRCPLKDIRIRHIVVLEDPFPDPEGFTPPSRSPSPTPNQIRSLRLADDDEDAPEAGERAPEEVEADRRAADTTAAALTLEMVGDLPFAEVRPPENILFVCKLNPVTRSDDLELLFSRFGKILSCQVICDKRTGDSLQYAFIEFDLKEDAERAYLKMQNVLIDDRRIWVDFSQSVGQLHSNWVHKRTGKRPPAAPQPRDNRHDSRSPRYDRDTRDRTVNKRTDSKGSDRSGADRRNDDRHYKRSRYDDDRSSSRHERDDKHSDRRQRDDHYSDRRPRDSHSSRHSHSSRDHDRRR